MNPMDPRTDAVDEEILAQLRELGSDDPAFLPGLVRQFLVHADVALASLRKAVVKEDADLLEHVAHGLKGSAASMGARDLADLCRQLVTLGQSRGAAAAKPQVEAVATEVD